MKGEVFATRALAFAPGEDAVIAMGYGTSAMVLNAAHFSLNLRLNCHRYPLVITLLAARTHTFSRMSTPSDVQVQAIVPWG